MSANRWPYAGREYRKRLGTYPRQEGAPIVPIDNDNPRSLVEGDWRDRAACQGHDTALWFPIITPGRRYEPGEGEAICKSCPVKAECALLARRTKAPDGIWGGQLRNYRSR